MSGRGPNLFVVGAMRAGTTALHEVLNSHPDIFMSGFKEPAFFADPVELAQDSRIVSAAGYAGNLEKYLDLFRDAGDATYRGESSTHYTKAPGITGVAARIAAESPDARIIYIVRDPVVRTLSHYRFAVQRKEERRSCMAALRANPFYAAVSDYATQIAPFLHEVGKTNVYLVELEAMAANSAKELRKLYEWLGVDASGGSLEFQQRNMTRPAERARGPAVLHRMSRSESYRRLARKYIPVALRDRVRRVLHRPFQPGETDDPAVMHYLRTLHAPQVERLEELMGRTFERWTTARPQDM